MCTDLIDDLPAEVLQPTDPSMRQWLRDGVVVMRPYVEGMQQNAATYVQMRSGHCFTPDEARYMVPDGRNIIC